jgi:heme exporter protein C
MLAPLFIMALAFTLFYFAVVLVRVRAEILNRERNTDWVAQLIGARP